MAEPKRILVIASHPDDEVLGCGGTMAAHADAGESIRRLDLFAGTVEVLCEEDMGIVSP